MSLVNFTKRKIRILLLRMLKPLVDEITLSTFQVYGSKERLHISSSAKVTNSLFNTFSGSIYIEDNAFTGHNVSFLTGSHDYHLVGQKRMEDIQISGRDIIVRKGVWIGSNATILGPCEIGENSVIAAGSIVTRDVPARVLSAGAPAKLIREIICD